MAHISKLKQYIFTTFFVLLLVTSYAGKGKTYYFTGSWDGNMVEIFNAQQMNKNKFCIKKVYINGKKIKMNYKNSLLDINPEAYGFKKDEEFLIQIDTQGNCRPDFNSEGFILQKD